MKIGGMYSYRDGEAMVYHYALGELYEEVKHVIFSVHVGILPEKEKNGVEPIKKMFKDAFVERGWTPEVPIPLEAREELRGDEDTKMDFRKVHYNGHGLGVEFQTGYYERPLKDFLRFQKAIQIGMVKVGVLIVLMKDTAYYMSDRIASFETVVDTLKGFGTQAYRDLSLVVFGVAHDQFTDRPLPKQRVGRRAQRKT
jgi:hypothetical protein